MYTTTVQKVGDDLVLSISPDLRDELQLEPGTKLTIDLVGRTLVFARPRRKYNLQELLDQCDPSAPVSEEDKQWDAMKPVGEEIL
jgi:antitoxin ChpS